MPAIINEDGDLEFRMQGQPLVSWSNPKFSQEHLSWVSSMMNDVFMQGRLKGIQENQKAVCDALGLSAKSIITVQLKE